MRKKKDLFSIVFNTIMLALLCIAYSFFIAGLVTKNGMLAAIMGVIIIACLLIMSVEVLVKKGRLKPFDWVAASIYYVSAISFVCAYLASIPEDPVREVVTSIASATIGGLLTLMGVGITIKYSRIEKEEDEIKRCIPRVFPISPSTWDNTDKKTQNEVVFNEWKTKLEKPKSGERAFYIGNIYLATTDLSMCVYDGIVINDKELWFDFGVVLDKSRSYVLVHNLKFKLEEEPKTVSLLLTDMLDNTYKANMSFKIMKTKNKTFEITITSILNTKLFIRDNKIR